MDRDNADIAIAQATILVWVHLSDGQATDRELMALHHVFGMQYEDSTRDEVVFFVDRILARLQPLDDAARLALIADAIKILSRAPREIIESCYLQCEFIAYSDGLHEREEAFLRTLRTSWEIPHQLEGDGQPPDGYMTVLADHGDRLGEPALIPSALALHAHVAILGQFQSFDGEIPNDRVRPTVALLSEAFGWPEEDAQSRFANAVESVASIGKQTEEGIARSILSDAETIGELESEDVLHLFLGQYEMVLRQGKREILECRSGVLNELCNVWGLPRRCKDLAIDEGLQSADMHERGKAVLEGPPDFEKAIQKLQGMNPLEPEDVGERHPSWGIDPINAPVTMFDCPSCKELVGINFVITQKTETCGICGFDVRAFVLLQAELNRKEGFIEDGISKGRTRLAARIEDSTPSATSSRDSSGCLVILAPIFGSFLSALVSAFE